MRVLCLGFSLVIATCTTLTVAAQTQQPVPAAQRSSPGTWSTSATLQPALDALQGTIAGLRLDKWKRGSVRDEADTNVNSIQRDLKTTLPTLLAGADAGGYAGSPAISRVLPVYRNVEALYDVLLRVVEASRVSAPGDQVGALEAAAAKLEAGRRAIGEHLQDAAVAQEARLSELQHSLQAQPVCPQAVPATPAPAAPKKRKKKAAAASTAPR
jgi:hypothetical protein